MKIKSHIPCFDFVLKNIRLNSPIFEKFFVMHTGVLFVCLGNICRSPAAEAIFSDMLKKKGLGEKFRVDSAGTSAWHTGEPADQRMRLHAGQRGYDISGVSRLFDPDTDFDKFDLILAMDDFVLNDLKLAARSDEDRKKLVKMTRYSRKFGYTSVPDPYYGGEEGFELVLDLLEDACEYLIKDLMKS